MLIKSITAERDKPNQDMHWFKAKLLQTYGFGLVSTEALKSIIWLYCGLVQSIGPLKASLCYYWIVMAELSIVNQVQISKQGSYG